MASVVAYARDDRRLNPPPEVVDAQLLKAFPGRTLDELDGMDWGRWQRATEAQMHLDVERVRAQMLDGSTKAADLPDGVAALIREHDALVGDDDDGEG